MGIYDVLPFKMDPIELGFKYLGCRLKPLGYGINNWRWLLKTFERRISHWYYRLLSPSGRLVLIRAVLTSLPVYWFSLAPVPKYILNRLRQLIFSFLWGSTGDKHQLHLVDWKSLSIPLEFGRWDIKNLDWFNTSLRLKSPWMDLNGSGIWLQITSTKYLKDLL